MLEGLFDWFQSFGMAFTVLGLSFIFMLDSTVIPTPPEFFAVLAFLIRPSPEWAGILLVAICLSELAGNSIMYSLVKWKRLPGFVERAIKKWIGFLVLKDERIILLNRVAPVMPFTGAFIATCNWNYKKSMLYLAIGCLLKYSALFALVALFDYQFDRDTAQVVSIMAVIMVVALSMLASYIYRKRHGPAGD
ncbi:MAG: hypothetical protein KKH41_04910 [Candidatus Thermoplasmatota archaeon]|nr:hypothetical protein [Euryarchaeota archaeon]MBU4031469.1 hypothetical protein [Candidatus Thermoplasmatota archaeon]MBU4072209.1 hypothetical protein [Candidatus Thermoplasmatota archaeon]MBU4143978.1 hypothetical protein [Candidatus Thermoplasmatota archaeon]MBU4591908.1 hypothetical protein [Candidatus Thermoplasmatota archaeon]